MSSLNLKVKCFKWSVLTVWTVLTVSFDCFDCLQCLDCILLLKPSFYCFHCPDCFYCFECLLLLWLSWLFFFFTVMTVLTVLIVLSVLSVRHIRLYSPENSATSLMQICVRVMSRILWWSKVEIMRKSLQVMEKSLESYWKIIGKSLKNWPQEKHLIFMAKFFALTWGIIGSSSILVISLNKTLSELQCYVFSVHLGWMKSMMIKKNSSLLHMYFLCEPEVKLVPSNQNLAKNCGRW